jgi:UDPglucose 6-dehydrogenase
MKSKTNVPFDYVSNPEFLKEGAAVEDFMRPDRIIIGTSSSTARDTMQQLYAPFMRKSNRIIFMEPVSAEMTKYAANTMLATRISFMNEIAALCEKVGADVEHVRHGIGSDSRIGSAFLFPGVGFGGSCFPKDIRALIHTGAEYGTQMTIAKAVNQVNIHARQRFVDRILEYFAGRHHDTRLAAWGLAFKAKTDDIRESAAIYCIQKLLESGMAVKAYDPEACTGAARVLTGKIEMCRNGYETLENADGLIILTDWQEFRNPDFELIAAKLGKPVIFDGRNLYEPQVVAKAGIEYHSVGRTAVLP